MAGTQTILTIAQELADNLNIPRPSALVGSSDAMARQLLSLINEAGRDLRRLFNWPQLTKEWIFSTVASQANYAMPGDFEKFHDGSAYDRSLLWQMTGPITVQEWQNIKSGVINSSPYRRFRFKGASSSRFFLDPTPTDTSTLVFEYQSGNWYLPIAWTTGYTFTAATYCSYNGIIYYTSGGGVTGATPPTHTTGSVSDGAVTWTYVNENDLQRFAKDTDQPLIHWMTVMKWAKFMFLKGKGLEYGAAEESAMDDAKQEFMNQRGARTLSFAPKINSGMLSERNIPDQLVGF